MTLQELRDAARSKADEQNEEFIPNAELDRFINQGGTYVHSKITAREPDFFLVKGTVGNGGLFSTVAGTQSYALPATLKRLVKVECRQLSSTDDNDWRPIQRANIVNDRPETYYPRLYADSLWFAYFLSASELNFKPVPKSPYQVRLWFGTRYVPLVNPSDELGLPLDYQHLVSEYAAIQCLAKSGEGIFAERQRIMEMELENLLSTIQPRDQASAQMVITDHEDYEGI